jgi:S-adenosylmethionine decarboxylase
MELEWVGYTRKNFNFPHKQLFPHTSPEDEVKFLKGMFDQWNIEAFVLGPITGDHWYVIIADHSNRPAETSFDRTIDVRRGVVVCVCPRPHQCPMLLPCVVLPVLSAPQLMMFDMDPAVSAKFMHTPEDVVHKDVTLKAGIDTIMPAAEIQEWAFSPCGYSCNAMLGDAYHTIHITPEPHCSYASFETNIKLPSYNKIIQRVLDLFRPKRFTLTVFADREGVAQCTDTPYTMTYDSSNPDFVYVLSSRSHAEVCVCLFVSFNGGSLHDSHSNPRVCCVAGW